MNLPLRFWGSANSRSWSITRRNIHKFQRNTRCNLLSAWYPFNFSTISTISKLVLDISWLEFLISATKGITSCSKRALCFTRLWKWNEKNICFLSHFDSVFVIERTNATFFLEFIRHNSGITTPYQTRLKNRKKENCTLTFEMACRATITLSR